MVEILDDLVEKGSDTMDVRIKDQVVSRMKAAVASKQFGQESLLCSLIADVSTCCSFVDVHVAVNFSSLTIIDIWVMHVLFFSGMYSSLS